MNYAHHERPKILIQADLPKYAVHPIQGYVVGRIGIDRVLMRVRMIVEEISVAVGMRMNNFLRRLVSNGSGRHRSHKSSHIPYAEDNQHHGDRQLHAEPDAHGNDKIEKNNSSPNHKDGESVAQAPKTSD